MFKRICAYICFVTMLFSALNISYAMNLSEDKVFYEDLEGTTYNYPTSFNDTRTFVAGDDVNTSNFADITSALHWKILDTWSKGTVVFDFRAKYNGSSEYGFGVLQTRDGGTGETWNRRLELRITNTSWYYYRLIVDYSNQQVTAYRSQNGFSDLEPVTLAAEFIKDGSGNDAEGMKLFSLGHLSFDDLSIYSNPSGTDWISDMKNDATNISTVPEINFSFFSQIDDAFPMGDNCYFENTQSPVENVAADVVYKSTGITVRPQEQLKNSTEYILHVNGLKNVGQETVEDISLRFRTMDLLKVNRCIFSSNGENPGDLIGDVVVDFNLSNLADFDIDLTARIGVSENSDDTFDMWENTAEKLITVYQGEQNINLTSETVNVSDDHSGKYIRFDITSNGQILFEAEPVKIIKSSKPQQVKFAVHEDFEGTVEYWNGKELIDGDGVNKTNFIKTDAGATLGYITLTSEMNGEVLIQFRAKSVGQGYFGMTTRQDSSYQKTISYTNQNTSQNNNWGYYRLLLDCDNGTGKVYYSPDSFTEMTESTGEIVYESANGFNQITFNNCAIDDISVLKKPHDGAFSYNINNGVEVIFYSQMDDSTFNENNISLYNLADNSNITNLENVGQFGFKAIPSENVIYNKNYRLTMLENISSALGEKISKTSFDFKLGAEPKDNLIKISEAQLLNGDEASDTVLEGANSVKLIASNKSGQDIEAVVTLALYRNGSEADLMTEYVQKDVTISKSATDLEIITEAIDVPECRVGEYSLRVFIGTEAAPFATIADVSGFGQNKINSEQNENVSDDEYKVTLNPITLNYDACVIKISGNVHSGDGKRVVIVIKSSNGETVYIGESESVSENGSFSLKTLIPNSISGGEYTVEAYAEKVTDKAQGSFNINALNLKPTALGVSIDGVVAALEKVKAAYSYYHPSGSEVADVSYEWYIDDNENGSFASKVGDEIEYLIKSLDSGKYIKCAVTVSDGQNTSAKIYSKAFRIIPKPIASNLTVKGSLKAGTKAYAAYEYTHADMAQESGSEIEWFVSSDVNTGYISAGFGEYLSLTNNMVGNYVKFTVIPNSETGAGEKQESSPYQVIKADPQVTTSDLGNKTTPIVLPNNVEKNDTPTQPSQETVNRFLDMENHWAKDIVEQLKNDGVVNGRSSSEFAPDEKITRGEFCVLLAKIGDFKSDKYNEFSDLSSESYCYSYVNALYEMGILTGYDGYMRPDEFITREEAAAIVVRYADVKNIGQKNNTIAAFTDNDKISQWATEFVTESANIGIFVGDEANNFNPKNNLTRAESAAVVYRLMGNESIESENNVYKVSLSETLGITDTSNLFSGNFVSKDDFYAIYRQLGGMEAEKGTDNITFFEVIKYLMKLLGYDHVAELGGGSFESYVRYANQIKLTDDAVYNEQSYLLPNQLMEIVDNMLFINVYEKRLSGSDIIYDTKDIFLRERFSIRKINGIINATEQSSIYGRDVLTESYIEIDSVLYQTKSNYFELLGYRVEAYYDETNDIVVYIRPEENKNEITILDAEKVESISDGELTYIPDGKTSVKRIKLKSYTPVILNNVFIGYTNTIGGESIIPERGKITCIDNNRDGEYDVLLVKKYDLYVVDNVNATRGVISFKNQDNSIRLVDESKEILYSIKLNENEITLADIKEWDVLAVVYSENSKGNQCYDINVIRRTLTGEFTGIDEEHIYINSQPYKKLEAFDSSKIMMGKEYTFLFAGNDDIIWCQDTEFYRYGYLISVWVDEDEETIFLKLVDDKGEEKRIVLNDRVSYNGQRYKDNEIYDQLVVGNETRQQMIKYCLNEDNTLKSFYTAETVYSDAETPDEDIFFHKTEKSSRYEALNTYGFLYSMASGSTSFFINSDEEKLDSKDISVGTRSGTSNSSVVCEFFDVDAMGQAKVSIFYTSNSNISDDVPSACFVDDIQIAIDDDGNPGTRISYYYYFNGKYETAFVADDAEKQPNSSFYVYTSYDAINDINDIERGDIIQVAKNSLGVIESFRVLYDASADNSYGMLIRSTNVQTPGIEILYSPVYEMSGSKIKVASGNGSMRVCDLSGSGNHFAAYAYNKELNTLENSDYNNILSVKDVGNEALASKVVLVMQYGYVRCIMIEDEF